MALINSSTSYNNALQSELAYNSIQQINVILQTLHTILRKYYTPVTIILGTFNNILVIFVISACPNFRKKTSPTALIYYMALAVFDIIDFYTFHFLDFVGIRKEIDMRDFL